MYTVVPYKKKTDVRDHQYNFKDFTTFYEIGGLITYPLIGMYDVGIKTDKVSDLQEFINISQKYTAFNITIYATESIVNYVSLYNQNMPVKGVASPFDIYKQLVAKKNILFGKNMLYLLYNSIDHDTSDMDDALNQVVQEYGESTEITEVMLAKMFVLNKTTYPRTVLIAYLSMDRYRETKLKKCLKEMGNGVVLGAMVKNLKKILEDKEKYYKTGQATTFTKSIDTKNLMLMYRVLVVERGGLNDVVLLLKLYEGGLSSNDIIQRRVI